MTVKMRFATRMFLLTESHRQRSSVARTHAPIHYQVVPDACEPRPVLRRLVTGPILSPARGLHFLFWMVMTALFVAVPRTLRLTHT
jgi:hypothetical protein